ncbi:MAG: SusD/RagB family nutrient-binding outer membrane lipoprotein [Saprospiraceae bacterium]
MKNIFKIKIALIAMVLAFSSCNKFDIENVNPDVASNIENNPELLLTNVIWNSVNNMVGSGWSEGNLMAQYGARIVFTSFDQFEWGSQSGTWNGLYNSIRNAQVLRENAVTNENPSYEAVALVMESWMYQILTDMWGEIPYSEAIKGKSEDPIYQPGYDTQEAIYAGLLENLKRANELLAGNNLSGIKGDILFNGDLGKWRKFANSLRLRVALRLSNIQPDVAKSHISEIYSNPAQYPVMDSNNDNAALNYLAANPNVHPISEVSGYRVGSFNEYRMSETVEGVLKSFNDPRLETWFQATTESQNSGNPVWQGMLNGVVDGTAYTYKGGDAFLSKFAKDFYFIPNYLEGIMMLYSEVELIYAEAAQRGWISGDAQSHYETGITANFEYWQTEMPSDYFSRNGVAYDGNIQTILTQKWLALFYTDFQGFCEFKRTGFPSVIKPGPDAFLSVYPSRFLYPQSEQALNNGNRMEAINRQGPDEISTKLWWEKR